MFFAKFYHFQNLSLKENICVVSIISKQPSRQDLEPTFTSIVLKKVNRTAIGYSVSSKINTIGVNLYLLSGHFINSNAKRRPKVLGMIL